MSIRCPKCKTNNPETPWFCGECGTQLPSIEDIEFTETLETPKEELTTGSTFAGRYQIIEELGKGGMGRMEDCLVLSGQIPGMVEEAENRWIEE